jgi:hypothetical protein
MDTRPSVELLFSDDFLKAIGDAITRWAYAEIEVDRTIVFLRNADAARKLTDKLPRPFKLRAKLLTDSAAACFAQCPPLVKRIHDLTNDLRSLYKQRNFLAHGRWGFSDSSDLDCVLITDGTWQNSETRRFNKEQIEALAADIGTAAAGLHAINMAWSHWTLSATEQSALQDFRLNNLPRFPNFSPP